MTGACPTELIHPVVSSDADNPTYGEYLKEGSPAIPGNRYKTL
jgi:hypothetical protein